MSRSTLVSSQGPPLALDRVLHPRKTKKNPQGPAKPLTRLADLAHTVDERYVLAFAPTTPLSIPPFLPSAQILISLIQKSVEEFKISLSCSPGSGLSNGTLGKVPQLETTAPISASKSFQSLTSQNSLENCFMTSLKVPAAAKNSKNNPVALSPSKPMNKGHLPVCQAPSAAAHPATLPPSTPTPPLSPLPPQKTPCLPQAPCQLIL